VTERAPADRRNQDLKSTLGSNPTHPGDDLVRVLVKLTDEVERFDSMILLQRRIIEDRARHLNDVDDEEVSREAQAIKLEADELVVRARQALDELRRMGDPTRPAAPDSTVPDRSPALARNRHAR
jgi:hypothetical protein